MRLTVACISFFVLLMPTGSFAHNPSEEDGLFLCRLMAFIQPDVARNACSEQSFEMTEKLEERLSTLGFLSQSEADVCADNLCKVVSGGERITLDPASLHQVIEQSRNQQITLLMARSPQERADECLSIVS